MHIRPECDVPVPGIFHCLRGIGTGIGKIWYRTKSHGTGIGKNWYQKKVLEPVSEKICNQKFSEPVSERFGTGKSIGIAIV